MDIDLVYTWVDGCDVEWLKRKRAYEGNIDKSDADVFGEARYVDSDELKYSLRSVELYAPWIHHIYIVTDDQTPSWLDTSNSKVTIVSQSEIMPSEVRPTFSSPAIELCLPNISGLSEYFLYSNDDMLLAAPVEPSDFFNADGYPIVRLRPQRLSKSKSRNSVYMTTVWRMYEAVRAKYSKSYPYAPHHNIDSYRKSDFEACKEAFPELAERTIHNRFRSAGDMQRCMVHYYSLAVGHAELRFVGRYNYAQGVLERLRCFVTNRFKSDSRCIPLLVRDYDTVLRKYNPLMVCFNDDNHCGAEDRRRMHDFLERKFPRKSRFEK